MKLLILNGPNLNLLGTREPAVYGKQGFDEFLTRMKADFPTLDFSYRQSNIEGELINELQSAVGCYDGVILNAGGYTHTSVALGDCIKAIEIPVVEVHISNTLSRENFRHNSMISHAVKGIIIGFGLQSYELAARWFLMQDRG